MIALDTNVLVRLLVADDEPQTARASALVAQLENSGERAHVSEVVVCELVWVLRARYGFERLEIVKALDLLFSTEELHFSSPDRLHNALRAYAAGKGNFADYCIRESARSSDCSEVKTFDNALLGEAMFSAP